MAWLYSISIVSMICNIFFFLLFLKDKLSDKKRAVRTGLMTQADVSSDQQGSKNNIGNALGSIQTSSCIDHIAKNKEEIFLQNAKAIVLKNIHLPDFTIEDLADILGISRSQLFRKLKSAVDQTPLVFIHSLRMDKAAQLLVSSEKNISEVAYSLGFSDVNYFRKVFHKYFGMSPSKYIETHKMNILSIVS